MDFYLLLTMEAIGKATRKATIDGEMFTTDDTSLTDTNVTIG